MPGCRRRGTTGVAGPGAKARSPVELMALKTKLNFFGFLLNVEQSTRSSCDGPKIIKHTIFRSMPDQTWPDCFFTRS